jgi:acid phosphatase class B
MLERLTIGISPRFLAAVAAERDEKLAVITEELEHHIDEVSALLTSYHWNERGVVHSVLISRESIQMDSSGMGQFKVSYGVNIHYGCSDIDIELSKTMLIGIHINLQTGEALLIGEDIPEREPDSF